MLFMLLLTFAHAKETRLHTVTAAAETNVCEILGDKAYADLGDALKAVTNGQTIKLLQNINYQKTNSNGIEIDGKSITFDLNGFNLNVVADNIALYVRNDGEVKLTGIGEFNVTSKSSAGVAAQNGGKATVANVTGFSHGVSADNNTTVTVTGNVTSIENSSRGIQAYDNATVTVHGSVTGNLYGIWARNNATVTVTGNVTSTGGNTMDSGIDADGNVNVTVGGDVSAKWYGIYAKNGAVVKVAGNTTGDNSTGGYSGPFGTDKPRGCGIIASSGSNVSVGGDAIGVDCGVSISDNATVTVSGSATGKQYGIQAESGTHVTAGSAKGEIADGIDAGKGANVTVTGGVTGGRFGILVRDNNTIVTVTGNVSGSGQDGISTMNGSKVTVTGDVIGGGNGVITRQNSMVNVSGSVTGNNNSGVYAIDNSTVTIGGDVIGNRGVNIQYGGNGVSLQDVKGVKVTIDGQIKAKEPQDYGYIMISTETDNPFSITYLSFSHSDNQPTSSKAGYLEYTDGKSYVWVKGEDITGTDNILQPSSSLKAYIQNGCLHVSGLTVGDLWTVYNLSGMIVHQNRAAAEEADINLPAKGIYIIVSARQSAKAGNF